ncbi:MAG TPA: HRDC domain-containing protein [Solirubrobacteraceae bacterium]|nr:HRDC domain-containing protein [Solirubrobacteraceae bacterium]
MTIADIAARARETGRLGIDTEFMGEGRYRSLLCLVQVAVLDDDPSAPSIVEVIDPLDEAIDPAPLAAVLADPAVEIIMHAGRQDVALLRRSWQTEVTNVFDTQVAAGFAGLRAQAGYESLIREVLGIKLHKSASFTRWDARPLSDEQVSYAREDVLHLIQLAIELQQRLAASGRLEWAREECRLLEGVSDVREAQSVFNKLPRVNSLDAGQRAVALELTVWREEAAREGDRPVQSVLGDAALVELAKRRPKDKERLLQIRGLSEAAMHRRGGQILDAIARGRQRAPIPAEGEAPPQPDPLDAALTALAEALVRARALESRLAYELIAAKADLGRIVVAVRDGRAEPAVRTLEGWRRELVGEELLALLRGELSLRVGPSREVCVEPTGVETAGASA